ncbi:MAG TPA: methyltransferase domain-containing protein [Chitinophagaceae bacterium]|nr:methyltransferase domain-containing protein [Chitinophagaceae bacterium]
MKNSSGVYKYWVRTALGLEAIFLEELAGKYDIKGPAISHRSVFFELRTAVAETELCTGLRTADDIYRFLGSVAGVDRTKQSVQHIEQYFSQHVLPAVPRLQPVRVTASFLGERNFTRYYIESLLNGILSAKPGATILSNEHEDKWTAGETRIRVHIEDDQAYFGMGVQDKPLHRRQWRTESYSAQLHPPVAAALAFAAKPVHGHPVIDPFCGSGTILIESALQHEGMQHIGFDIDASAIHIAAQNARLAGVDIECRQEDFIHHYKNFEGYTLISNPPWGEKHGIDERFFDNLFNIISAAGSSVMLVPEELKNKLTGAGISPETICTTRVRGKLASILRITSAS